MSKQKRLMYEPPCAMRVADKRTAAGDCDSGSGDYTCGSAGNSATDQCGPVGNGALGIGCNATGNSAVTYCNTGNAFAGT